MSFFLNNCIDGIGQKQFTSVFDIFGQSLFCILIFLLSFYWFMLIICAFACCIYLHGYSVSSSGILPTLAYRMVSIDGAHIFLGH